MTDPLSTLPPEVREALSTLNTLLLTQHVDRTIHSFHVEAWLILRAELLRVYAENERLRRSNGNKAAELIGASREIEYQANRAHQAEAELAQLRAKIETAPIGYVGRQREMIVELSLQAPAPLFGKRVRLVADDEIRALLDAKEG